MAPQRTAERAPSTRWVKPKLAAIRAAVIRLWQRTGGARSSSRPRDAGWEQELEGLQDAVYRQAVLERENIGDLRRRTEPEQLARDLGQDARRRGL